MENPLFRALSYTSNFSRERRRLRLLTFAFPYLPTLVSLLHVVDETTTNSPPINTGYLCALRKEPKQGLEDGLRASGMHAR